MSRRKWTVKTDVGEDRTRACETIRGSHLFCSARQRSLYSIFLTIYMQLCFYDCRRWKRRFKTKHVLHALYSCKHVFNGSGCVCFRGGVNNITLKGRVHVAVRRGNLMKSEGFCRRRIQKPNLKTTVFAFCFLLRCTEVAEGSPPPHTYQYDVEIYIYTRATQQANEWGCL